MPDAVTTTLPPARGTDDAELLRLSSVHAGYGQVAVLHGIDIAVSRGECVVLLGPNGMGKTTTLRVTSGIVSPTAGTITFGGKRIDSLAPHKIARRGISHVPEGRGIFPGLSVEENLRLGTYGRKPSASEDKAAMERALDLFPDLRTRMEQRAGTLSGGQQQMLAISRGLMGRPELLILDEPSLGLAPKLVDQVFDALGEVKRQGTTILLVEQSANHALAIADRGYVLNRGQVVLAGRASDLAGKLHGAYLS
jgi:branched-chain amino acid transport system ATP-binding protein